MVDLDKYLASKPAVATVSLIALQSTFYVLPLFTITTDKSHPMTVLDDWVLDQGSVFPPPPLKPWLWAYLGTASLSLLLWALGGWKRTRDPSLYTALIAAVFGAYVVDALALYVAQIDGLRDSAAELGPQVVLLLAWPVVPLLVEAGTSLAEFVN